MAVSVARMDIIWSSTLSFCFFAISVATVIIYVRTRSKQSLVMCAGLALLWLGLIFAFFGPKTTTTLGPELSAGGHTASITTIVSPSLPIGYLLGVGIVLFAIGFFAHAIRKAT